MRPHVSFSCALLTAAVIATGCGNHGKALLPNMSSGTMLHGARILTQSPNRLVFDIDVNGFSPDGAYHIHSLHDPQVHVHQAFSSVTPNGTYTQVEYSTPFGPLTIVQSPKRQSPPPPPPSTDDATPDITVVQSGTSTRGARWFIFEDRAQKHTYSIHAEFKHSVVDTEVPSSVPISEIQKAIEELY